MSNKTIVSCRNCSDRYPGCHQNCNTYKKERAEYDRLMAEENKGKEAYCYSANEINKKVFANIKKKKYHRNSGYIE